MKKISIFLALFLSIFIISACSKKTVNNDDLNSKSNNDLENIEPAYYTIDTKNSVLKWEGRRIASFQEGEVGIKSGFVEVLENNTISTSSIIIDMDTITDSDHNHRLVLHLKSSDFFEVEKYPYSILEIKKIEKINNNQFNVNADLTIKDITHETSFIANVKENDGKLIADAQFSVDRVKYNIRYGSKTFFEDIGKAEILNNINFDVHLEAIKN